jgi:ATP-dependent Clp protease ATP-binding subunit ClpC
MFERLTDRSRRSIVLARQHAFRFAHDSVDVPHLVLGLLEESMHTDGVVTRLLGADLATFTAAVERALPRGVRATDAAAPLPFTPAARALFVRAAAEADAARIERIDVEHLVIALALDEDGAGARLVASCGRPLEQVRRDARDLVAPRSGEADTSAQEARRTPALDAYCDDLLARARQGRLDPLIGRQAELEQLFATLLRHRDGNALILGKPGVGRTALLRGLAIAIAEGTAPTPLLDARVFTLDTLALLAGTRYRGQLEERLKALLYEARKLGNVILALDDADAALGEEGSSTASIPAHESSAGFLPMLKNAFDAGEIRFVFTLREDGAETLPRLQPSLARHLQVLELAPATPVETLAITRGIKSRLETLHAARIDDAALTAACSARDEFRALPGSAVDLLDRACSAVTAGRNAPNAELNTIDAEIARLEAEEVEHVRLREFIKAAAGREAIESLLKKRTSLLGNSKIECVVDAVAIRVASGAGRVGAGELAP